MSLIPGTEWRFNEGPHDRDIAAFFERRDSRPIPAQVWIGYTDHAGRGRIRVVAAFAPQPLIQSIHQARRRA